jgi:hypothetical protein
VVERVDFVDGFDEPVLDEVVLPAGLVVVPRVLFVAAVDPDDADADDADEDDAGRDDAGADDAGPDDAGADDAGPDDAGPDDAGAGEAGLRCGAATAGSPSDPP